MKQVYTFHETVRGYSHIRNGVPCEDYSGSFSDENGRYHIAIIADGHGDSACFRSAVGSKTVVEVTMECLQEFAESTLALLEGENRFYQDMFTNQRYQQMTIKTLTNAIMSRWNERIKEDYTANPPTQEEMGSYASMYENGKNTAHIYGTTVIAALLLPGCLILLQQGDGRCDVFYQDGTVNQPIPWDPRCEGRCTTSMCDEDAVNSIRSCVLNLEKHKVIACYLGSDGVEDAFRDSEESLGGIHERMGGVHTFYKYVTLTLMNRPKDKFGEYLKDFLSEFSEKGCFGGRGGSEDDVSVAGIVDMEAVAGYMQEFARDIRQYEMEEALFWQQDELRGKSRKHGILQKRMEEAADLLEEAKKELEKLDDKVRQGLDRKQEIIQKKEQIRQELDKARKDFEISKNCLINTENTVGSVLDSVVRSVQRVWPIDSFIDGNNQYCNDLEQKEQLQCEGLKKLEDKLQVVQQNRNKQMEKVEKLETAYKEAKSNFDEYDAKYQEINRECQKIEGEIASLRNKDSILEENAVTDDTLKA